jgi:tetratricopeptide (TPR) repeat protein
LSSVFVAFLRIESSVKSGNVRDATTTFQTILEKKPSSTVFAKFAEFCASQGDVDQAKKYFHKSVAMNELNPVPYNVLGHFLVSMDNHENAISAFRKGLELNPYDESALLSLAKCLTKDGYHCEEAERLLQRGALLNQETNVDVQGRLEMITEKPTGMNVGSREKQKALEAAERKETLEHVSTYLDFLFSQKKALFPAPF